MTDGRFYGVYPGVCVDNADPEKRSRIRLKCRMVLGESLSNWAEACLPAVDNSTHTTHTATITTSADGPASHTHTVGVNLPHSAHTKVPSLNQKVWIMFVGGDPNFPIWIGVGA